MPPTIHQSAGPHEAHTGCTLHNSSGYQALDQAQHTAGVAQGALGQQPAAGALPANSLPGWGNQVRTAATWLEGLQQMAIPVRGRDHLRGGKGYRHETKVLLNTCGHLKLNGTLSEQKFSKSVFWPTSPWTFPATGISGARYLVMLSPPLT